MAPDAGNIALEIAHIANQTCEKEALAEQLAQLLLARFDANAVICYWTHQQQNKAQLHPLATAQKTPLSPKLERTLKRTAYRAFSKRDFVLQTPTGKIPTFSGSVVALPMTHSVPWAVFALWAPHQHLSNEVPALRAIQPSLMLATKPAYLLDMAKHADVEHAQQSAASLAATDRIRTNFISILSHELRTPLNSINGFVEIVTEGQVGPLNERQQEFLGYVRSSAHQLTALVEDILLLSRADAGKVILHQENIVIETITQQAIQSVQAAADKAQVRIISQLQENLSPMQGDARRVQHVLISLLNNAIKFSPAHEEVLLTIEKKDNHLEFAIQDHGNGLPPAEHQRVFERFYQTASSQRSHSGGVGLGLTISRLIVEQHHGNIWLESTPGAGTTVYFTLPLSTPPATPVEC